MTSRAAPRDSVTDAEGEMEWMVRSELGTELRLERTRLGSNGRTWIAHGSDGQRYFVKVVGNPELLQRLGDLGVAPRVIRTAALQAGQLVVQESIEGPIPDGPWIDANIAKVGGLVRRYHSAAELGRGLALQTADTTVEALEHRCRAVAGRSPTLDRVLSAVLASLRARLPSLGVAEAVLTHGDPNHSNMLRTGESIALVDWDDVARCDPILDIGQILWWYVRPERWGEGLVAAGLTDEPPVRARLYWWVAAESLDVALWMMERGARVPALDFGRDAFAASRSEPNPRAWWLTTVRA